MDGKTDTRTGILILKVKTGLGVYPVPAAVITILSERGSESDVEAVVYTDTAGISPPLILPAGEIGSALPGSSGLLHPNTYTVEVDKDGFYAVARYGVPVFPGVTSVQTVYLTPLPDHTGIHESFPDGRIPEDGNE